MIKAIGGYFELADNDGFYGYPVDGILLNTCRNALEHIICHLPHLSCIYLPLYTCEAVVEPLIRQSIPYHFYHINERFELAEDIVLKEGEYLIANNYFGLKDAYLATLAERYGQQLIIDNAQALFAPVLPGIKAAYSTRKYVGVADGGIAVGITNDRVDSYPQDDASLHDSHLIIRKAQGAEAGFRDYQQNEGRLDNQPVRRMAPQTQQILQHINYQQVIACRRRNFEHLHNALGACNRLMFPDIQSFICPMVYPFWSTDESLRGRLIENKVFVARYWPNVLEWAEEGDLEHQFARQLLPLPVDQRYDELDMNRIIEIINNH